MAMLSAVDEVYDRGGKIRTDGWRVGQVQLLTLEAPTQVRLLVDSAPQAFKVPGERVQRFDGGASVKVFTLQRTSSGWNVIHLDQS
jgi:hypothetical protein